MSHVGLLRHQKNPDPLKCTSDIPPAYFSHSPVRSRDSSCAGLSTGTCKDLIVHPSPDSSCRLQSLQLSFWLPPRPRSLSPPHQRQRLRVSPESFAPQPLALSAHFPKHFAPAHRWPR